MSTYDNNAMYRPLIANGNNTNIASSVCNWFKHIKFYKIVCLILILLFVVPMIAHYYILNVSLKLKLWIIFNFCVFFPHTLNFIFRKFQVESDNSETEIHHSRSQLDVYEDISNFRAPDLKLRIEEMLRIKVRKLLNKILNPNWFHGEKKYFFLQF